jgi:hypothetical protein
MKTIQKLLLLSLIMLTVISANPYKCFAENGEPIKYANETCSPLITTNVHVTLLNDCEAVQYCTFEILIFDLPSCSIDNPPIATKDNLYGNTIDFLNLTFNSAKIIVCVRLKPGYNCSGYTYYAPKCECRDVSSSDMYFELDICIP